MVEVFATNITDESAAESLLIILKSHYPNSRINFDLDDCDKILRIEGEDIVIMNIISIVKKNGFNCNVLN